MSVSGPCEICLTGTVEHTCDRCGNLVCSEHFDEGTGFCVECAAEMGQDGGERDERGPDGTDTYQF